MDSLKQPRVQPSEADVAATGDLKDELTCSICLELFEKPVLLPCGHPFCRTCVDQVCGRKLFVSCPFCRTEFMRGGYTSSLVLAKLVEKVRGEFPLRSSARHSDGLCTEHDEKLLWFCKDDGDLACTVCQDALKHSNHNFLLLQEAHDLYKGLLMATIIPLSTAMQKLEDVENNYKTRIRHYKYDTNSKTSISSMYGKLRRGLEHLEVKMHDEICAQETAQFGIQESVKDVKEHCLRIQETISAAQSMLNEQDPLTFLKGIKSCLEKCSEEQAVRVPEVSMSQRAPRCPAAFRIWRQLKPSKLVPSRLTLDPETAYGRLVLSHDRTTMHFSNKCRCLADHPKRFIKVSAVLGSEGYTSGMHYWVVDVGSAAAWIIGVVEESISRKDRLELLPDNGAWVLELTRDNTYTALQTPARILPLTSTPTKIGVCVDFDAAVISFYCAKEMTHLHSIGFSTSSKLFAYFQLFAGAPRNKCELLTICH
ncbi:zinc-binding protein A33-like isoform X1 [Lissotriton helveticus]